MNTNIKEVNEHINNLENEVARLREENAELKQGKVFVDPKWIYDLEIQLAKAHEELCQAGIREYGI
jgi:predicted nuclease with TOPRIM domain